MFDPPHGTTLYASATDCGGQRSRSQQAITQKPYEHHISKTNEWNFTQFWSHMYVGL